MKVDKRSSSSARRTTSPSLEDDTFAGECGLFTTLERRNDNMTPGGMKQGTGSDCRQLFDDEAGRLH